MLPHGQGVDFLVLRTGLGWRKILYTLGASFGLSDGDPDGCTSCDSVSDGDVTFSFHTYLVCGLNIGGVGASFTTSLGSSSSSQLFIGD